MLRTKATILALPLLMAVGGTAFAVQPVSQQAPDSFQLAQATTTVNPNNGVTQTTTTDPANGTTQTVTTNPSTGTSTTQTTTTETVTLAPSAPPPPETESVPPPPSSVVYWQPGRWSWSGTSWAWVPGQYVQRPQPTAVWQPGHWEQAANGGWQWTDGHWE
jgi:hypothetical protein